MIKNIRYFPLKVDTIAVSVKFFKSFEKFFVKNVNNSVDKFSKRGIM